MSLFFVFKGRRQSRRAGQILCRQRTQVWWILQGAESAEMQDRKILSICRRQRHGFLVLITQPVRGWEAAVKSVKGLFLRNVGTDGFIHGRRAQDASGGGRGRTHSSQERPSLSSSFKSARLKPHCHLHHFPKSRSGCRTGRYAVISADSNKQFGAPGSGTKSANLKRGRSGRAPARRRCRPGGSS